MSQEAIDSYIDRAGIKSDTDFILGQLNSVYSQFQKLNSVSVSLGGIKGAKDLTQSIKDLTAAQEKYAKSTVDILKVKKLESDIELRNAKTKTEEAKASKEGAAAKEKEARASTESAKAKQIEERLIKSVTREKDKQTALLIKEAEKVGKLNNEYEQLKAKYLIASNSAKQLAAAKGLDNAETVEAIAVAQKYYQSLLSIERAVGQSQRNVGNYREATFALTQVLREAPAFANSFATGISAIGNNVPILTDQIRKLRESGLGTAQIFKVLAGSLFSFQALLPIGFLLIQSYGKEISQFFSGLFSGSKSMTVAARAQRDLSDAFKEGSSEAHKQVATLETLYQVSQDVNQTLETRKDATKGVLQILKDHNETTGENIKLTTDQNGVLKEQPDLIDKISDSLIKQAKTKSLLNLIEKAYTAELEAQTATLTSQTNRLQDLSLKGFRIIDEFFGGGRAPKTIEVQTGLKEKAIKDAKAYTTTLKETLLNGLKTGEFNLGDLFGKGGGNEKLKDNIKEINKLDASARKRSFENVRAVLQDQIKAAQEALSSEKATFQQRLDASQQYYDLNFQLISAQKAFEQSELKQATDEAIAAAAKRGKEEKLTSKQIQDEKNAILRDAKAKELGIEAEANSAIIDLDINAGKQRTDITKQYLDDLEKARKESNDRTIKDAEHGFAIELLKAELTKNQKLVILSEQYAEGKIKEKEYQEEKRKIEDAYLLESLKAQLDNAEKLIQIKKLLGEDTTEDERKLAKLRIDLDNQVAENSIKNNEKVGESDEKLNEKRRQNTIKYINEAGSLISSLIETTTIAGERALNNIQDQIDSLEAQKQKDIEVVNQTVANREEAAAQISIIEARAKAKREQLEREQREIKNQNARRERLAQINKAIADGASAVIEALPNIPLSILVGAIAATTLFQLTAAPIPKYKDGKDETDLYEGPAVVGDGGKSELIVREDGSMEVTPNTPTLTYVKSKDIVLPDARQALAASAMQETDKALIQRPAMNDSQIQLKATEYAIKAVGKSIVDAIRNKQELHIHNSEAGMKMLVNHALNQVNYLNNSINW